MTIIWLSWIKLLLSGGSGVEKERKERKSPNRGTEKDAFQFSLYFLENNMDDNDDNDNDDNDDNDSDIDDDNIVVTRQHDSDCVSRKFCHF